MVPEAKAGELFGRIMFSRANMRLIWDFQANKGMIQSNLPGHPRSKMRAGNPGQDCFFVVKRKANCCLFVWNFQANRGRGVLSLIWDTRSS